MFLFLENTISANNKDRISFASNDINVCVFQKHIFLYFGMQTNKRLLFSLVEFWSYTLYIMYVFDLYNLPQLHVDHYWVRSVETLGSECIIFSA